MASNKYYNKILFDEGAQGALLLFLFGQLFLTNGIYLFLGALTFGILLYQLQQPLKPSVFSIMLIYHFIQISANIWLSNYLGKDINFRSEHTGIATVISYAGLFVMFWPIIQYQQKIPVITVDTLKRHANRLSIDKCFKAYIIAFFVANALGGIAFAVKGLSQIIISFINIKWFFFALFGFQVFLKNKMKKQFYFITAFEFVMGFLSYFSDFKTVMFFLAFIAIIFITKVRLKHIIITSIVIIAAFFLGAKWTSIKSEYRSFLNQGKKSQSVTVTREDALSKLIELSSKDYEGVEDPTTEFLDRIQYTHHLAKAMDRVPAVIPYQDGDNWKETLEFVLTPRALNPDKPRFEATKKTTKYTGIAYVGYESGTSFSLGYFADCYIDFGTIGMFLPLLILGFVFGSSYFYFMKHCSSNFIFNYSIVGAMFMELHAFEMDSTYLVGRLFSTLLTFYILNIFFFPWLLRQLTAAPDAAPKPQAGKANFLPA